MILLIDNYDSFTYNLVDYFKQLGAKVVVHRNNVSLDEIKLLNIDRLVISPGPGRPENAGNLNAIIDHYHRKVPILGVCLGHQALAQFFGAEIKKAKMPMHGKVSKISLLADSLLLRNLPKHFEVVRYHSLLIDLKHSNQLLSLAETKEGENMIMAHKWLPIYGVQYHPEAALCQYGLEILDNFLKLESHKNIGIRLQESLR